MPPCRCICGRRQLSRNLRSIADQNRCERLPRAPRASGSASRPTTGGNSVRRDDIDVIDICTPPDSASQDCARGDRPRQARPRREADRPEQRGGARDVRGAAEAARVKHLVGFSYRRTPAVLYARQLIDDGVLRPPLQLPGLLPAGLVRRPASPPDLAPCCQHRGLRDPRRHRVSHHRYRTDDDGR